MNTSANVSDGEQGFAGIILLLCTIVGTILEGLVGASLWRWFVMPLAPSAPVITPPAFVGVSLLIAFVLPKPQTSAYDGKQGWDLAGVAFNRAVASPLVIWFVAWLVWRLWL